MLCCPGSVGTLAPEGGFSTGDASHPGACAVWSLDKTITEGKGPLTDILKASRPRLSMSSSLDEFFLHCSGRMPGPHQPDHCQCEKGKIYF